MPNCSVPLCQRQVWQVLGRGTALRRKPSTELQGWGLAGVGEGVWLVCWGRLFILLKIPV